MFVYVSAWDNLTPSENNLLVSNKIALMTKHAGVSVLVTSLTDFVAFGIGSTTVSEWLKGKERVVLYRVPDSMGMVCFLMWGPTLVLSKDPPPPPLGSGTRYNITRAISKLLKKTNVRKNRSLADRQTDTFLPSFRKSFCARHSKGI